MTRSFPIVVTLMVPNAEYVLIYGVVERNIRLRSHQPATF
jgi:hypothetical protein